MSYSEELIGRIEAFRDRVMTDPVGVLDPPTQHHEFVSGNHGRKLDFDKILTGSDFFKQWTNVYAQWISERYRNDLPDALIGVANGANRLSSSVAPFVVDTISGLLTDKVDKKTVKANSASRFIIQQLKPEFVLIIEDVGTTGSTTATLVEDLQSLGVSRIEAVTTWQRNPNLEQLDKLGIMYSSMIPEALPMFKPEECRSNSEGFCNQGVLLIPHGQ